VAEWGYHGPKLLGSGLWAARVPRGICSDDSQDEATCGGSGNGDVKYSGATSETIRSRHAFTFRRSGRRRTWQGIRFKRIVTRYKYT
jgi:hypothetical protein